MSWTVYCFIQLIMKNKLNKLACITTFLASALISCAFAGESFIPLQKGLRSASDDLLYENRVLSTREADSLVNSKKVDLSKLNPKPNDLWSNSVTPINDQQAIALKDGETLTYEGSIGSSSGLFRFNAIPLNGNKIYIIHMDRTLHALLMRKNLLRALGYKIPAMKYLKNVTIKFPSKFAMENFINNEVSNGVVGSANRWIVKNDAQSQQLLLTLQDVAVTEPEENDFYNVALGVPQDIINSRSLRALVIPYSLADYYETINKFSWVDGKLDNKSIILQHFTSNEFATTIDDAVWMLIKLNKLTRADYQKIVAESYFPKEFEGLMVEKLISRRNGLNRLFSQKVAELAFNPKISIGSVVKEGKIIQKEFPGYASRFAYGDAESPLEQLSYFLYSKLESNVIDNLMSKLNSEMSIFDLGDKRTDYFQKQFKEGLDHYVETGELLPIKVGVWPAPVLDFQLILSRDIILGNYLGTDNLVQLADTFGAGVDIGVFAGIEGLGYDLTSSLKVSTSLVRTYSHLKPVKSLKASLKEPFKNIFVGLLKRSLKEKFFNLSELKEINTDAVSTDAFKEERKKKIEAVFKEINKGLDVGESLIITDRLVPSVNVRLNFNQGLIGAGVGVNAGVTVLKRIHLLKKSATILQIYDDSGFVKNIDLSFHVSNYINLIKLNAGMDRGHYNVNSYMVNLDEDGPDLFKNALGVYNVLKSKDFELLAQTNPPVKLDVQFKDKNKGVSLLFWRMKSLTGKTYYDIRAKDGVQGTYYSLEKDFLTGLNPEAFSKQLLNYYIAKSSEDIQITEEANRNPGESFFGRSHTQKMRFEAVVDENKKFGQKFLELSDVKQGWAMSEKSIKKFMASVNKKFQANLFEASKIDFKKLRLYNVAYHMNVYNKGLEKLHSISIAEIEKLENKYKFTRACGEDHPDKATAACGNLSWVKSVMKKCSKSGSDEEKADCSVALFEKLMDDLDFSDFSALVGADNFYVYGTIDGFREKSETLNDTVYSNTIGKIGNKQWNGPLDVVRELLGLTGGEFSGSWIRKGL
jgi:hypothetical protein